jgi:hypothetical protein
MRRSQRNLKVEILEELNAVVKNAQNGEKNEEKNNTPRNHPIQIGPIDENVEGENGTLTTSSSSSSPSSLLSVSPNPTTQPTISLDSLKSLLKMYQYSNNSMLLGYQGDINDQNAQIDQNDAKISQNGVNTYKNTKDPPNIYQLVEDHYTYNNTNTHDATSSTPGVVSPISYCYDPEMRKISREIIAIFSKQYNLLTIPPILTNIEPLVMSTTTVADYALSCVININLDISRSFLLNEIVKKHLLKTFSTFSVTLGFGLHVGWAIEGPIGSTAKIDPSYLSIHANLSETLESLTKVYSVPLLMTGDFVSLLSPAFRLLCRKVDRVVFSTRLRHLLPSLHLHQRQEFYGEKNDIVEKSLEDYFEGNFEEFFYEQLSLLPQYYHYHHYYTGSIGAENIIGYNADGDSGRGYKSDLLAKNRNNNEKNQNFCAEKKLCSQCENQKNDPYSKNSENYALLKSIFFKLRLLAPPPVDTRENDYDENIDSDSDNSSDDDFDEFFSTLEMESNFTNLNQKNRGNTNNNTKNNTKNKNTKRTKLQIKEENYSDFFSNKFPTLSPNSPSPFSSSKTSTNPIHKEQREEYSPYQYAFLIRHVHNLPLLSFLNRKLSLNIPSGALELYYKHLFLSNNCLATDLYTFDMDTLDILKTSQQEMRCFEEIKSLRVDQLEALFFNTNLVYIFFQQYQKKRLFAYPHWDDDIDNYDDSGVGEDVHNGYSDSREGDISWETHLSRDDDEGNKNNDENNNSTEKSTPKNAQKNTSPKIVLTNAPRAFAKLSPPILPARCIDLLSELILLWDNDVFETEVKKYNLISPSKLTLSQCLALNYKVYNPYIPDESIGAILFKIVQVVYATWRLNYFSSPFPAGSSNATDYNNGLYDNQHNTTQYGPFGPVNNEYLDEKNTKNGNNRQKSTPIVSVNVGPDPLSDGPCRTTVPMTRFDFIIENNHNDVLPLIGLTGGNDGYDGYDAGRNGEGEFSIQNGNDENYLYYLDKKSKINFQNESNNFDQNNIDHNFPSQQQQQQQQENQSTSNNLHLVNTITRIETRNDIYDRERDIKYDTIFQNGAKNSNNSGAHLDNIDTNHYNGNLTHNNDDRRIGNDNKPPEMSKYYSHCPNSTPQDQNPHTNPTISPQHNTTNTNDIVSLFLQSIGEFDRSYNSGPYFLHSATPVASLQASIPIGFRRNATLAVEYYIRGEWRLSQWYCLLAQKHYPQDESLNVIYNYMLGYDFIAPPDWRGFRFIG